MNNSRKFKERDFIDKFLLYHTSLSTKFKDLSISIVDSSNIRAFYSNNGGLHLNNKDLGRLAVNLKLKICKL